MLQVVPRAQVGTSGFRQQQHTTSQNIVMDRFSYHVLNAAQRPSLEEGESQICSEGNIRLYDGDDQTSFDCGELVLTTHRLLWVEASAKKDRTALQLPLSSIEHVAYKAGFLFSSPKVICHLYPLAAHDVKAPGPVEKSSHSFVKLSFRHSSSGAPEDYMDRIEEVLDRFNLLHVDPCVGTRSSGMGEEEANRACQYG